MSAPSDLHESRVHLLETLATLAGYTFVAPLDATVEPDVVRWDLRRRRVLLGDAKETETAGTAATQSRLGGYVDRSAILQASGTDVLFVIAHGERSTSERWLGVLRRLADSAGLDVARAGGAALHDAECVLTYVLARRV